MSNFRSRLATEIAEQFSQSLPEYSLIAPVYPNAVCAYSRVGKFGKTFFVVFATPPDRDEFTVELAWSFDGRYPLDRKIQSPFIAEGQFTPDSTRGESFRLRLDRLWGSRRDFWWNKKSAETLLQEMEELVRNVEKGRKPGESDRDFEARITTVGAPSVANLRDMVGDALGKFKTYGQPYFIEVDRAVAE